MNLELFTEVMLLEDFPQFNLKAGDIAMYIEHLMSQQGKEGAILEIFNAVGESLGIATVPMSAIASITSDYLPAVRPMKAS
jgi:hypothetical protein